uniref:Uncharacterized protein n=1 Tax=Ciona intestinalis TaxID=7719 RepID=H2XWT3_CIOIN
MHFPYCACVYVNIDLCFVLFSNIYTSFIVFRNGQHLCFLQHMQTGQLYVQMLLNSRPEIMSG